MKKIDEFIEKKKDEVVFKKATHQYFVNGEIYPSVTTILNSVIAKPFLMYWAVKEAVSYIGENLDRVVNKELILNNENASKILSEAKKAHEKIKEDAGKIGSESHAIIEKINRGEVFDEKEIQDFDVRLRNSVNAYLSWKKEVSFEPTEPEFISYSKKYKYAGMIDCVGKIDNKLVLVDYKTSNNLYPEYWLQLAGYYGAYSEMFPEQKIVDCYIVRFGKEDGIFEAKNIKDISIMKGYYKVFLSAFDLWKWQQEQKKEGIKKWKAK